MRSHLRSTRLCLEPLEDRCLPSTFLPPFPAPPGDLREGPAAASFGPQEAGRTGNVVSAFAADAGGVRVLWGESAIIDGSRIVTWALVSPHDHTILAAGVTFSLKLAQDLPDE